MWARWNCGSGPIRAVGSSGRAGYRFGDDFFRADRLSEREVRGDGCHLRRELFPAQFDIIYAFNAFYAFPDQQAALRTLRLAAKPASILCLFDYLDRGAFKETRFARKPETLLWRPLSMTSLRSELDQTGWSLREWTDISQHYDTWYHEFVKRFAARRSSLLERFAAELVAYAEDYYCSLLETISAGALGGAIVYAQAKPRNS